MTPAMPYHRVVLGNEMFEDPECKKRVLWGGNRVEFNVGSDTNVGCYVKMKSGPGARRNVVRKTHKSEDQKYPLSAAE